MNELVVPLRHTETPAVQTEALATLQNALGPDHSRDIIERAVFELSDRLWQMEKALHENEIKQAGRIAGSLVAISVQIGLSEFADVAADLTKCVERNDRNALAAVGARLIRVGERSLNMAVQFPESTG